METKEKSVKRMSFSRYAPYGVGKLIGSKIYIHKSYENVFYNDPEAMLPYINACEHVKDLDSKYLVVSYHKALKVFTFSWCADFDTNPEPIIGDQLVVFPDGTVKKINMNAQNPFIYHHKWLMVGSDYKGFDVAASQRRSFMWTSLPNIDYSRIGRLQFWRVNVIPELNKILFEDEDTNVSVEIHKFNEPVGSEGFKYTAFAFIKGQSVAFEMGLGTTPNKAMKALNEKLDETYKFNAEQFQKTKELIDFTKTIKIK